MGDTAEAGKVLMHWASSLAITVRTHLSCLVEYYTCNMVPSSLIPAEAMMTTMRVQLRVASQPTADQMREQARLRLAERPR